MSRVKLYISLIVLSLFASLAINPNVVLNALGGAYETGFVVSQNDVKAAKWYGIAAERGNTNGQYKLGYMHQKGRGVPQSDEEAVRLYRLVAAKGYSTAQNQLGIM
ncbi:MAG: tetratricopeptide repeat protein [Kangiellaceae bacterium]